MAILPKNFKFCNWRYAEPSKPDTCVGSRYKTEYSAKLDDNGVLTLQEVGQSDNYEYIQSFAQSVDINTIMSRYKSGDTSVLERVQGFYFDTSNLPDNMPELLNKLNYAESEFSKLPAEFKEQYGNDFTRFICTFDPDQLSALVSRSGSAPVVSDSDPKEVKHDE